MSLPNLERTRSPYTHKPTGRTKDKKHRATVEDEEDDEEDVEEIERNIPIPKAGRQFIDPEKYPPVNVPVVYDDDAPTDDEDFEWVFAETGEVYNPDESDSDEPIKPTKHGKAGKPKEHAKEEIEKPEEFDGTIQTHYQVQDWFPDDIKKMFKVNRYGGQLKFQVSFSFPASTRTVAHRKQELNRMTKYRDAMERVKRRRWKKYLRAGHKRWQYQREERNMRRGAHRTPELYAHKKALHEKWDKKAFKRWQRLEKLHLGLRVLDETIDLNFRQERIIYEFRLDGRRTVFADS